MPMAALSTFGGALGGLLGQSTNMKRLASVFVAGGRGALRLVLCGGGGGMGVGG